MHEMALAEGILQVVLDAAEDQQVRRVRLQVGRLQMVVPDSLQFSFELVAEGTAAARAALEIEEIPARLRCGACGAESELDLPPFNCRLCGASDIDVTSGREVIVDSVELGNGDTIKRREVPAAEILEEHLEDHAAHDGGNVH
jgi:hydrogenase nickel incorporation protein HypA/HybF